MSVLPPSRKPTVRTVGFLWEQQYSVTTEPSSEVGYRVVVKFTPESNPELLTYN